MRDAGHMDDDEPDPVTMEKTVRAINEELDEVGVRGKARSGGVEGNVYACECSDPGCEEMLIVDKDEYSRIRQNQQAFIVLPGHEQTEIERVIETTPHYFVVEKFEPVGS